MEKPGKARRPRVPSAGDRGLMEEIRIGPKIKDLRKKRDLTLQAVAEDTGLSPALISQIERGNVSPPIATLARLARFFDVRLGYFFRDREADPPYGLIRHDERQVVDRLISREGRRYGYQYEVLSSYSRRRRMEAFFLTIEKVAKEKAILYSHEGEEFLYVLRGKVKLLIEEEQIVLRKGDAVHFDSSYRHRLVNQGRGATQVIAVIYR